MKNTMLVCLARGELPPPTEPGFYQGFFSISVAFGLLICRHLIFVNINDLIAETLFEENQTELDDDDDITESTMNWL